MFWVVDFGECYQRFHILWRGMLYYAVQSKIDIKEPNNATGPDMESHRLLCSVVWNLSAHPRQSKKLENG